jgi:DNA repair exonuclease SbcCD nuclease subunit
MDNYAMSVLDKIQYVIDNNDVSICLGDLFHKPAVSNVLMHSLIDILQDAQDKGKRVLSLYGNHDIANANIDKGNIEKTSLSLLFKTGLLRELKSEKFGSLVVDAIPFLRKTNGLKLHTDHSPSILVGHYFYESSLDEDYSIHESQIGGSGYKFLILGHDHSPADPVEVGGTKVIIPGAIGRNTSHAYNLTRNVRYFRVVLDEVTGGISSSFETVPCAPAREVFNTSAMDKPSESTYAFLDNMSRLLEGFKRVSGTGIMTIRQALETCQTPPHCVEYLRRVHERLNIDF